MASVETLPGKSSTHSSRERLRSRLASSWDLLAVLLLVLITLPANWLAPRSLIIMPIAGMFDDHWIYDTVFKASRGIVFGRDVAFPYGPLFQWMASSPALLTGMSMGNIPGLFHTFLLW